ncbi:MAG TPA: DUF4381 family protein [Steroidobacteraceae bacterium]|nr:DUF4381 family protein [Steroidobacteraceae bacterium]
MGERRIARGCTWAAVLAGAQWSGCALATAADDIHDIRGPKPVSGSWLPAALVAFIVAVAVALGAYVLWRRGHRGPGHRILTLSELSLERLDATRSLMKPDSAREFASSVSEVIRHYIEKRFEVLATVRTTEEFLQTLLHTSNEALARERESLAQFLQQCDFVKFAGASLEVRDMESLLQSGRRFVLESGEPPVA